MYAGDSINFQIGTATYIGTTTDTTFTHINALTTSIRRFYTVVLFTSNMVLIPEGLYYMGADYASPESTPIHAVYLSAYYIDIYEVTNGEYKAFCDATSRAYPHDPGFSGMSNYFTDTDYEDYPVVNVSWSDAREYARWAGKRLPTEAEWERAAKGSTDNRQWPWGNIWSNYNANIHSNYYDYYPFTSPIGSYPDGMSPVGCYDMAGNVWEWCEDDWHNDYTDAPSNGSAWIDSPRGAKRVKRGGSWTDDSLHVRCAQRDVNSPTQPVFNLGFRCAKSVENRKPLRPSLPSPADSSQTISINTDLAWSCSDPDLDIVFYDVYFGTSSTPPLVSSGQTDTTYDPGTLAYGTVFYWQIVAYDFPGSIKNGPVWNFSTESTTGMVLVPAGVFSMGADYAGATALPVHSVNPSAFYIDMYETTNGEYKAFCDATSHAYPLDPGFTGMPDYFTNAAYVNYPVVNVSWYDARAYAIWVGKRLPSEAEWERAAKGSSDNRQWPWGDTWIDTNANIGGGNGDGYVYTSPVGAFPGGISPEGCYDMIGNAREWCEDDWHDDYTGAPNNGSAWNDDPRGTERVERGGHYLSGTFGTPKIAARSHRDPAEVLTTNGFRCAKSSVNRPPTRPSLPSPEDSSYNQSINVDLSWTCSDPDLDYLTYDIYFGTSSTPPLVSSGTSDTTYDPGTLVSGTVYYWKIVVYDNHGNSKTGLVWNFTTDIQAYMVLVPSGSYTMGSTVVGGYAIPEHTFNVDSFYIDAYEVTNAQYKAFCDATSRAYPPDPYFSGTNYFTDPAYVNYPVVNVTWNDARAYADWMDKRLPTEAEWERAAKGSTDNRLWPWGDTWAVGNANIVSNPPDGYTYTSPVGHYPLGVSPAGCYDMAGNVWEWCEDDWHDNYTSAPTSGSAWMDSPRGSSRVVRGGSWVNDDANARCAYRFKGYPATRYTFTGFRCAKSVANKSPLAPSLPSPAHGSSNQSIHVNLSWTGYDPDLDSLVYAVHFGTSSTPLLVSSGQPATTYDPGPLSFNTAYWWRIVAYDIHGASISGPTWTFTSEDNGVMVLVPEGPYTMGSTVVGGSAIPEHTVNAPAFYIDKYLVTNAQYMAFCDSVHRTYPRSPYPSFYSYYFSAYPNYPVINVSWDDARAYADWAGKRLPTEAEWERAAKGNTDNRQWPWGDAWVAANANIYDNPADSSTYTSLVGNYPNGISPAGCYDMAGNVWEWCEDDGHVNYTGAPSDGSAWIDIPRDTTRIARGGSWSDSNTTARCAHRRRLYPAVYDSCIGFRCARSVENGPPLSPSLPSPADSSGLQSIHVKLSWMSSDPDLDPLTYDVYFGTSETPPLVSSGQTAATYDPGTLLYQSNYWWRIVAHDPYGASMSGPVWTFSTEQMGDMVLVPAASFEMGWRVEYDWSMPVHTVFVPAFWIDRYEVTKAQYKAFADSTGCGYPNYDYYTNPAFDNYPALGVDWEHAKAYAAWVGKRLPTEAEWERAAKGNLDQRDWPWGYTWVDANANIGCGNNDGYDCYTESCAFGAAPVGSFPNGISPVGCYDMCGNVYEWCEDDWHESYRYGAPTDGSAWVDNPRSSDRVLRGGSNGSRRTEANCKNRWYENKYNRAINFGFRCAKTP